MSSFHFSKSIDALAERIALAPAHAPLSRVEIFQGVLSIPDFPKHLEKELNDNQTPARRRQHWGLCWEFMTTNKIPDPDAESIKESFHGRLGFTGFMPEDANQQGKRPGDIYPLKRSETKKARVFLQENPQMHAAVAGIQAGIVLYLDHLSAALIDKTKKAALKRDDMSEDDLKLRVAVLTDNLRTLSEGAESHSFLRDMSPILAAAYSKEGGEEMPALDSYRLGLLLAFERNAFLGAAPVNGEDFKCPFRHYFAQVLATKVAQTDGGNYQVSYGDKRQEFGALLSFFYDHFSGEQYEKPMQKVAELIAA